MTERQTAVMEMNVVHKMSCRRRKYIWFAKDSETLEEMVVYRALYGDGGLWVRPAKMFFETIERDGKTMKRFELLKGAAYSCFFVWSLLQIIGAHWTFEHVPMDWLTAYSA